MNKNHQHITDEELMISVQKGDQNAFTELYHRYSKRILLFLFKMLSQDEAVAQDILQEIFVMIAEKPEKFGGKNFKSWIFTVASNRCKNHFRDSKKKLEHFPEEEPIGVEEEPFKLDETSIKEKLNEALEQIHPTYKEAFILRYFEGLRNEEIAQVLGCPIGTVKSRLHNSLRALRKELKIFYEEYKS